MGSGFFSIEVVLNAKLKRTKKKLQHRWPLKIINFLNMFNKDKKRDVKTKWKIKNMT